MATVAVLSLALGIGVNTAIFSVFERLLLRRLPVPAAGQIVNVTSPGPKPGSRSTSNSGRVEALQLSAVPRSGATRSRRPETRRAS